MKLFLFFLLFLSGCAVNSGLDHRIVCGLDGKALFVVTYGPVALNQPVPDADAICGTLTKTPAVVVTPPVVAASGVK